MRSLRSAAAFASLVTIPLTVLALVWAWAAGRTSHDDILRMLFADTLSFVVLTAATALTPPRNGSGL